MGMETEDEEGQLARLGPLTQINASRRASAKHAETTARPWDAVRVHFAFEFSGALDGSPDGVRARLSTVEFPHGWTFLDINVQSYSHRRALAIFEVEHTAISLSNGAQVRALINLVK